MAAASKPSLSVFAGIMFFYLLLTYVLFPVSFYYIYNKSIFAAGNGFVLGSILSLLLWWGFGSKMVHPPTSK
jgi:hypothetical protein